MEISLIFLTKRHMTATLSAESRLQVCELTAAAVKEWDLALDSFHVLTKTLCSAEPSEILEIFRIHSQLDAVAACCCFFHAVPNNE